MPARAGILRSSAGGTFALPHAQKSARSRAPRDVDRAPRKEHRNSMHHGAVFDLRVSQRALCVGIRDDGFRVQTRVRITAISGQRGQRRQCFLTVTSPDAPAAETSGPALLRSLVRSWPIWGQAHASRCAWESWHTLGKVGRARARRGVRPQPAPWPCITLRAGARSRQGDRGSVVEPSTAARGSRRTLDPIRSPRTACSRDAPEGLRAALVEAKDGAAARPAAGRDRGPREAPLIRGVCQRNNGVLQRFTALDREGRVQALWIPLPCRVPLAPAKPKTSFDRS